ncbi:MAG: hypothetical protein HFJ47_01705 [Clostridia bacterium]|nr:hypothetical protein [Clostridia bacterium]
MNKEQAIKILEDIKDGSNICLTIELEREEKDNEEIEHYKNEVKAIETIINSHNKEKARADKLEKEYSKMLTKLDEYEARLQEYENSITEEVIKDLIETIKDKRRELCHTDNLTIEEKNTVDEILVEIHKSLEKALKGETICKT